MDDPAAFPCTGEGFGSDLYTQKGMTLRDYFAAHALQGLLATGEDYKDAEIDGGWEWYAAAAYNMANAMLAERIKEQSNG